VPAAKMRVPATARAAGLASNVQHCCYSGTGQKADHGAGTRRAGKKIDAQRVDTYKGTLFHLSRLDPRIENRRFWLHWVLDRPTRAVVCSTELRLGLLLVATAALVACKTKHRSHAQHTNHHTTEHMNETHDRTTLQRSAVARRRCVPPPTPGWVAVPKSAWEVGSKSDAPWRAQGSGAPRPAHRALASLRRAEAMRAMQPQRRRYVATYPEPAAWGDLAPACRQCLNAAELV